MSVTELLDEEQLKLQLTRLRMCLDENLTDVDGRPVKAGESVGPARTKGGSDCDGSRQIMPLYDDQDVGLDEDGKLAQLFRKWTDQWMTYWYPQGAFLFNPSPVDGTGQSQPECDPVHVHGAHTCTILCTTYTPEPLFPQTSP